MAPARYYLQTVIGKRAPIIVSITVMHTDWNMWFAAAPASAGAFRLNAGYALLLRIKSDRCPSAISAF
jgi:hypothetical protein